MAASFAPPVENFPSPGPLGPESGAPAGVAAERVLLLEDDPSFREVICDFLTESGYPVVTAQNGVEGVRELMRSEFAVILCDMLMPKLSGDMFYRAVEGIRPQLCQRFVFMTGHRGDENTNAFIQLVKGTVLMKPFSMRELLETIERTRRAGQETPGGASPAKPQELKTPVPVQDALIREVAKPRGPQPAAPAVVPAPKISSADSRSPAGAASPDSAPEFRAKVRWLGAGVLALCLAAGAGLGFHVRDLSKRTLAAEAALEIRQQEWARFSEGLQEAGQAQARIEARIALPARVAAARDVPLWTPALRRVVMNADPAISFRTIRARGLAAHPGAGELQIEGSATGREPRALAEDFRRTIEAALAGQSSVPMTVRFQQLEEEPPVETSGPELQRVRFTISATVQEPEPLQK